MIGLETALRVVQEAMVETGLLDWAGRRRPDVGPARPRSAGWPATGSRWRPGQPANLILFDPAAARRRSTRPRTRPGAATRRSPGRVLPGRVVATFLRGRPTVLDGKLA